MTRIPTLIETVRVREGRAPLWHLHLRRLVESCRALGVPFPGTFDVPAGHDRVVRLAVGARGLEVTERAVGSAEPVRLATARTRHPGYPHKTTDREPFDRARDEAAAAGADDALLLTHGGDVAECSIWALLWWEGDRLAGPPASLGVLRSVGRMRLEEQGEPQSPRVVRPEALAGRSLLVVNAARGVVPVASLDGVPVPPDPRTGRLAQRFWA
ncbi:MAG TPA: aminotransferase class IV [Gemmatimonadales bacterium]|nr:aminotransferase class IV [Gemmatimonadales bacterium]